MVRWYLSDMSQCRNGITYSFQQSNHMIIGCWPEAMPKRIVLLNSCWWCSGTAINLMHQLYGLIPFISYNRSNWISDWGEGVVGDLIRRALWSIYLGRLFPSRWGDEGFQHPPPTPWGYFWMSPSEFLSKLNDSLFGIWSNLGETLVWESSFTQTMHVFQREQTFIIYRAYKILPHSGQCYPTHVW